jgi:protein SCO1
MECKRTFISNRIRVSHRDTKNTKYITPCTSLLCGILVFFVSMMASCKQKSGLPYYNRADFTPAWSENNNLSHHIPQFSFIDQNNTIVTDKTFDNKIYIANFFFTSCGSICPRMMENLLKVQKAFPNNDHIGFISHTVTPWIDSVARLKKYAQRFGLDNRWHLVTGDKAAIYTLARQSYFAEEETGFTKDSTEFLHTEHILLIDAGKHIRGVYNGTLALETDRLIADIHQLLKEENF